MTTMDGAILALRSCLVSALSYTSGGLMVLV